MMITGPIRSGFRGRHESDRRQDRGLLLGREARHGRGAGGLGAQRRARSADAGAAHPQPPGAGPHRQARRSGGRVPGDGAGRHGGDPGPRHPHPGPARPQGAPGPGRAEDRQCHLPGGGQGPPQDQEVEPQGLLHRDPGHPRPCGERGPPQLRRERQRHRREHGRGREAHGRAGEEGAGGGPDHLHGEGLPRDHGLPPDPRRRRGLREHHLRGHLDPPGGGRASGPHGGRGHRRWRQGLQQHQAPGGAGAEARQACAVPRDRRGAGSLGFYGEGDRGCAGGCLHPHLAGG